MSCIPISYFLRLDFFQNNSFNLGAPNYMGILSLNNTNTHTKMDSYNINNPTLYDRDSFWNPNP
jgi:hypothetical protein